MGKLIKAALNEVGFKTGKILNFGKTSSPIKDNVTSLHQTLRDDFINLPKANTWYGRLIQRLSGSVGEAKFSSYKSSIDGLMKSSTNDTGIPASSGRAESSLGDAGFSGSAGASSSGEMVPRSESSSSGSSSGTIVD